MGNDMGEQLTKANIANQIKSLPSGHTLIIGTEHILPLADAEQMDLCDFALSLLDPGDLARVAVTATLLQVTFYRYF